MKKRRRTLILGICDILNFFIAGLVALIIRFDGNIPPGHFHLYLKGLVVAMPVMLVVYGFLGMYNRLWRYASISELWLVLKATTTFGLVAIVPVYGIWGFLNGFSRGAVVLM